MKEFRPADTPNHFLAPLRHGADLIEEIARVCRKQDIRHAAFSAIGAVSRASFGFYDQAQKKYGHVDLHGAFELIQCTGNLSLKNGEPFVHAHALFGREDGSTFGGHLMSPTTVFAAELYAAALEGPPPERILDSVTGLYLWAETP